MSKNDSRNDVATDSAVQDSKPQVSFDDLGLPSGIMTAIQEQGYETPSPIQAEAIPPLLKGRDILGQAQTGTGKTAAFALPLLTMLDPHSNRTQLLILAPTRELAIQVAEACQQYSKHLKGIEVLPIYGGQSYSIQLKALRRGVQVVVGTPGRVMDHMRRGTLDLKSLQALVLDEADEMLRMGFIDDVKWVLEQTPSDRQIALFSATMPREVKKVADQHLQNPVHIKIASTSTTGANIQQSYWMVRGTNKLDAITRILENEETDGVIVFVRTKNATVELADRLAARGMRSEPLNGDIPQANREKVIDRLKKGKLDILVATDVVARGLDVDRISHVINYDVPHDTESYVHRIGRTGRAGRKGKAILFLSPREKRMLHFIEKATKKTIEPMELPSVKDINVNRITRFKEKIATTIENENLDFFSQIVTEMQKEKEIASEQIAAALAFMAQADSPLLLDEKKMRDVPRSDSRDERQKFERRRDGKPAPSIKASRLKQFPDIDMARYVLAVGRRDRINPGNIVGAIANEADIESQYIGEIEIRDSYTTVDLPNDMPKEIMAILKKARVAGKQLSIKVFESSDAKDDEDSSDDHRPRKRSFNSKRRDGGGGRDRKPRSDYAERKRRDRR